MLLTPLFLIALSGCGVDFMSLFLYYQQAKDGIETKIQENFTPPAGEGTPNGVAVVGKTQVSEVNKVLSDLQAAAKTKIAFAKSKYGARAAAETQAIYNTMINSVAAASKTAPMDMDGFHRKANDLSAQANGKFIQLMTRYQAQADAAQNGLQ